MVGPVPALVDALEAALPQTQCTRCGYADCRGYAQAIADGEAHIGQCPPGGSAGVARLARLTGLAERALDPAYGREGPRYLAVIDEAACIGCTRCLKPCPVDCILGGPKAVHTVMAELCTGCELCIPACPVDCITLVNASGTLTGWAAWSPPQATQARQRYAIHQARWERDDAEEAARLAALAERRAAAGSASR